LIGKLVEIIDQDFIGVEVGIETGSPELAKKIMPAKAKPYDVEDWPEIVIDAFEIMHENNIIPAATIIVGLPDETEIDVIKTIDLIERLRDYRSLIVPMYFVPMGAFKDKDWFREDVKGVYAELARVCLKHNVYWIKKLVNTYFKRNIPLKALMWLVIKFVEIKTRNLTEGC